MRTYCIANLAITGSVAVAKLQLLPPLAIMASGWGNTVMPIITGSYSLVAMLARSTRYTK